MIHDYERFRLAFRARVRSHTATNDVKCANIRSHLEIRSIDHGFRSSFMTLSCQKLSPTLALIPLVNAKGDKTLSGSYLCRTASFGIIYHRFMLCLTLLYLLVCDAL